MKRKHAWLDYISYKYFHCIVIISVVIVLILSLFNDSEGTYTVEIVEHADIQPTFQMAKKKAFVQESKGERECRRVLEKLFNRPFTKNRPDFLHNSVTQKNLEIDCCNMDLRIGVEYNGRQHYEYVKGMHSSRDAFQNQCYRDNIKREICRKNGFVLIEVPYTIPIEKIEEFIRTKLKEYKLL